MPDLDLPKALETILVLLTRFQSTLYSPPPQSPDHSSPNPLALLKTSAITARSHVTKLSLLAITAPFTPSAIVKVLDELNTSVLPSLVTAALLLIPERFTIFFQEECLALTRRTLQTLQELIVTVEKVSGNSGVEGNSELREEVTIATGRTWEACDEAVELADGGVAIFVTRKVEEWYALVKDALQELEEWDPDNDYDDPFGDLESETGTCAINSSPANIGPPSTTNGETHERSAPETKYAAIVDSKTVAVSMLQILSRIYPPMIKRRMKTFPADAEESQLERLSRILETLKGLPNRADGLAEGYYDDDPSLVLENVEHIKALVEEYSNGLALKWDGDTDELTLWVGKWMAVVKPAIQKLENGKWITN